MSDAIHIPWYATGLRGDQLEAALVDVSPSALRYGATAWSVYRGDDDRYKLLQILHFADKTDFERWWNGKEMTEFRVITSGWWQVPILYYPQTLSGTGSIPANGNGNGGTRAPAEPAPEPAEA